MAISLRTAREDGFRKRSRSVAGEPASWAATLRRSSIGRYLVAPTSDDLTQDRLVQILYPIASAITILMFLSAGLVSFDFVTDDAPSAWVIQSSIISLMLVVIWLLRAGSATGAAVLFSCSLWLVVTCVTILMGGITSPTVTSYMVVTVLAGYVWGERGVIGFSAATLLVGLGMVWGHETGNIPSPISAITPMYGWMVLATSLVVLCVVIVVTIRVARNARQALHEKEEELRQAQKMEALGRFAGGIAHDFNNLLTAIAGHNDFLTQALEPNHPAREDAREVHEATERATSLTRQILAFSRHQVLQPRTVSLNRIVERARALLAPLIGEDIELRISLAPDLPPIVADPFQLEQVLMNLAANARDAMLRGGVLEIETYFESRDSDRGRVVLLVRDTGSGMDDATRERIFEPFFTTKELGQGTGLGLSSVYGIVEQSGGQISVVSTGPTGTTFKIQIPAAAQDAILVDEATADAPMPGSETLLVAEDDTSVRRLLERMLRGFGYRVLVASDGAEALRLAESRAEPIHLLVTDIVMPVIGGFELAERLKDCHPETRVLFVSGYVDEGTNRHSKLSQHGPVLWKPFSRDTLAQRVRSALDAED